MTLLDDVQVALDRLGGACAELRDKSVRQAPQSERFEYVGDRKDLEPSVQVANSALDEARALIARLRMRPHADPDLVARAKAAADAMFDSIAHIRVAMVGHELDLPDGVSLEVGRVPAAIARGLEETRAYEQLAREAVRRLLGAVPSQ